jgi:plastocyanin
MKNNIYFLLFSLIITAMVINTPGYAVKHIVSVSNFQFSPANVNASVGDTMRWVWSNGTHTTTSTPGAIPAGAASWDNAITNIVTSFEYIITVAGSYSYVCIPHSPGMAGTITATAAAPTLNVAPSNRSVTGTAGTTTFTVTSNSTWTASSNQGWCTGTSGGTGNGTITANYTANTTNAIRITTITVTVTGLAPQTVTVTQAASTVGFGEQAQDNLWVYPNPSRGLIKLNVGNLTDQLIDISIMDMSGKNILSGNYSGTGEYLFDLSQAPRGIYFARITAENIKTVRRIVLID